MALCHGLLYRMCLTRSRNTVPQMGLCHVLIRESCDTRLYCLLFLAENRKKKIVRTGVHKNNNNIDGLYRTEGDPVRKRVLNRPELYYRLSTIKVQSK